MSGAARERGNEGAGWLACVGRVAGALVDPTVVLSFDRTGFRLHRLAFRPDDLAVDLTGRVGLVTGANSGLGYETARELAARGAEVWMLCRDAGRGEAAAAEIRRACPGARLELAQVDVSERDSVRAFVERFDRPVVDILVNNAGVLPDSRRETTDGLELTWATNVVGPFLLTHLLLPRLQASSAARVITVSSGGMYPTRLSLADVEFRQGRFDGVQAYSLTKRAEVVLNELWAEREEASGIFFAAMHPGWADTPAVQSSLPGFHRFMKGRLRTPAEGADTIVWLSVCPRLSGKGGQFWFDREPRRTHWLPWTRESEAERAELWERVSLQAGVSGSAAARRRRS